MSNNTGTLMSRRTLLTRAALAGGGCFAGLLVGDGALAFAQSPQRDVLILNAALYLEHEAIAAYTAGAGSGLLPAPVLAVASAFMSDHQYHRDGIAGVVKQLGVEPPGPRPSYRFGALHSADDILRLALRLELGAATAYRTLASSVQSKAVLGFAAHVMVDEVRHTTVLRNALKLRNY